MKGRFFIALALTAACSSPIKQKNTVDAAKSHSSPTAMVTESHTSKQEEPDSAKAIAADSSRFERYSAAQVQQLLTRYDLSSELVQDPISPVPNGFFGPDHYRIEMVFTSVHQDSSRTEIFHVSGKSRHRKVITPFKGTMRLTKLWAYKADSSSEIAKILREGGIARKPYKALFNFELREDSRHKFAGVFTGESHLCFAVNNHGRLEPNYDIAGEYDVNPSVFWGSWQSYTNEKRVPVIWSREISFIAETILPEFNIGERELVINPKYAKLGWNNYWENDEWWADSPRPLLNL